MNQLTSRILFPTCKLINNFVSIRKIEQENNYSQRRWSKQEKDDDDTQTHLKQHQITGVKIFILNIINKKKKKKETKKKKKEKREAVY